MDDIKECLTITPVLRSPDWSQPFNIETDASALGLGAVLSQDFTYEHPEKPGQLVPRTHPIAYASRTTTAIEKRYLAFLLELIGVKWAFDKFADYIYGAQIHLITDCQALSGILSKHHLSPAHVGWAEGIRGHDIIKFTHRPGKLHRVCDELSRRANNPSEPPTTDDSVIPLNWEDHLERTATSTLRALLTREDDGSDTMSLSTPLRVPKPNDVHETDPATPNSSGHSINDLATATAQACFVEDGNRHSAVRARYSGDADFGPIVHYLSTLGPPSDATTAEFGRLRSKAKDFFLSNDDTLRYRPRTKNGDRECVPAWERKTLIKDRHEMLGHAGRDRLAAHLSSTFYWPKMALDISEYLPTCPKCQQFGPRVMRAQTNPVTVLRPMQLLSMDYMSLPAASGYKTVLVIIDYFTRYVWAYKFTTAGTGKTTIKALTDLFRVFGQPKVLMSDNGSHFANKEVDAFCADCAIVVAKTPPYSPHTNGAVEGANGLLINALKKELAAADLDENSCNNQWPHALDSLVAQLNSRVVGTTGHRPANLLFAYVRRNKDP
ncbi:hypothetical protein ACM66B_001072 [Microbotryomycetes sp. NB124-2]